jgi:hypothetical protein
MSYKRNGGIHFLKIGGLSLTISAKKRNLSLAEAGGAFLSSCVFLASVLVFAA